MVGIVVIVSVDKRNRSVWRHTAFVRAFWKEIQFSGHGERSDLHKYASSTIVIDARSDKSPPCQTEGGKLGAGMCETIVLCHKERAGLVSQYSWF